MGQTEILLAYQEIENIKAKVLEEWKKMNAPPVDIMKAIIAIQEEQDKIMKHIIKQ